MPELLGYCLLFAVVGAAFLLVNMLIGKLIRPAKQNPEKGSIYECGEPTVGSAWVQFDLRYYVVALLFVIFDVEVAFFFPWAVVYGKLNGLADPRLTPAERTALTTALLPAADGSAGPPISAEVQQTTANRMAWIAFVDILVFFGVLLVGFAYLWRRGDLNWVRSTAAERAKLEEAPRPPPEVTRPVLVQMGPPG